MLTNSKQDMTNYFEALKSEKCACNIILQIVVES